MNTDEWIILIGIWMTILFVLGWTISKITSRRLCSRCQRLKTRSKDGLCKKCLEVVKKLSENPVEIHFCPRCKAKLRPFCDGWYLCTGCGTYLVTTGYGSYTAIACRKGGKDDK